MGQSLYLKYRPQSFDMVVGQEYIIDILKAQSQKNEFNNSYLLYGPRGTGKTSTARLLAKAINATPDTSGEIDRKNDTAIQHITAGDTLDFVEIDAASHTGVDNIREEILDKAIYPPTTLKKKVYVIDEVHMLSKGAFNALLKIMEEPREYLVFILATTEIHKVPDTIISRCQTFTFRNLTITQITERLQYICEQESIGYELEGLELIAKMSNGALRDAIKYVEQISILGSITAESVSKFLGVAPSMQIETLMHSLKTKNYSDFEKQIDELVESGADLQSLLKEVFRWLDIHFAQDPKTWSPWVSIFQEISEHSKRYPRPELLWKKKAWMWCSQGGTVLRESAPSESIHQVPVESEIIVDKLTKNDYRSTESQGNVEIEITNQSNRIQASESAQPRISVEESTFLGSLDELLQKMVDSTDKKMIQGILSKQTIIDSLTDEKVTLIVINQLYAKTLQKDENVKYLEKIMQSITGQSHIVEVVYMSKEDFMKKQLGE